MIWPTKAKSKDKDAMDKDVHFQQKVSDMTYKDKLACYELVKYAIERLRNMPLRNKYQVKELQAMTELRDRMESELFR